MCLRTWKKKIGGKSALKMLAKNDYRVPLYCKFTTTTLMGESHLEWNKATKQKVTPKEKRMLVSDVVVVDVWGAGSSFVTL
jgi:hypothetical protein